MNLVSEVLSDDYLELLNILENKEIRTVFQPIVSLIDGNIIGYEALSRGPQGCSLESPVRLFGTAMQYNLVWELELLCRIKALERCKDILNNKMLFINVDPNIINDEKFGEGFTKEYLAQFNINPQNIIFEITEKTAIADYLKFRKVINHYVKQGYKIAIDDTGSGYSGLRTMAETCPHYIKIDMELIRNIDRDYFKQAILKTFNNLSWMTNIKIIAEGIETESELNTLIDLGIYYGQGYFIQKPSAGFLSIRPEAKKAIIMKNKNKSDLAYQIPSSISIGEIARAEKPINPEMLGRDVDLYFKENPGIQGLVVVEDKKPVGLMMKNKFYYQLASQYGVVVFMGRPIRLIMDHNPLTVDYKCPLDKVSLFSLARQDEQLYDYIVVTKDEEYYGVTTVKDLLEKTTQVELNIARHSNPLTGLPGNLLIEERIKDVLAGKAPFAIIYADLDHFKEYNDVYGFENGDNVLLTTANLLKRIFKSRADAFFGHLGGDDFIAILQDSLVEPLCEEIIREFEKIRYGFYTEYDQMKGFIRTKNRHGNEEDFPLLSISLAVVTNRKDCFSSVQKISETASALKRSCKATSGSCYVII